MSRTHTEGITEIVLRLRAAVEQRLKRLIGPFLQHRPADDAARKAIYLHDNAMASRFFRPTKVNTSSSSFTCKGAAGLGGRSGTCAARALTQFTTLCIELHGSLSRGCAVALALRFRHVLASADFARTVRPA